MPRKFERRIFLYQLMQPETDFLDIGIGLRLDRKGQHRPRKHRLWITNGSIFVTERIAGLRIFEFPNAHDLPWSGRGHDRMFLPQQRIEMSAFLFAAPRTVEDRRVCVKDPRQDPQVRQSSDKRVYQRLEDDSGKWVFMNGVATHGLACTRMQAFQRGSRRPVHRRW